MKEIKETYYRRTTPKLIKKLELMVDECLKIVGQKIAGDLSDDKMHNVIKSKRMAAEEAKWAAKEIDILEIELTENPSEVKKTTKNYSEQLAN